MKNQSGANHYFIAIGIMSIAVSAFVGLFSNVAFLGILAGIVMIWAAFPEKVKETVEAVEEQIDPTASQTSIGMKFDLD